MDFAVLTSPLWWMARQWLRFLTGLVIIAAALGASQPAADQAAAADAAAARPVVVAPPASGPVAGASVDAPVGAFASASVDASVGAASPSIVEVLVEPDPIVVAQAPVVVRSQRPASVALPAFVDVAPVGQRAPPAVASADVTV